VPLARVTLSTTDQALVRQADLGAPAAAGAAAAQASGGGSASGPGAPPGQLRVPSVAITGAVYPVGVDKTNTMEVTQNAFTVGWYKYGPLPGASGDSVETCHNEWYTTTRALCYNLHNVAIGADIYTRNADGKEHHWKVTSVRTVAYNASVPGLFDNSGPPRLSVITCGGQWLPKQQIFTLRVIVDAALADNA
jgi:hypothetical protein